MADVGVEQTRKTFEIGSKARRRRLAVRVSGDSKRRGRERDGIFL
jgi:hypothetical protein